MSRFLPAAVFLAVFGFFLSRTAPSIAPLDSAELAAAGASLGIAHSPGYPLYVLAGRAWCALGLGDAAYRMNLFSGLCVALAAAVLVRLFAEGGGWEGFAAGLSAAVVLVLPGSLQRLAVAAEVFGPHLFLLALFLACCRAALERGSLRALFMAAFLNGLALANQHIALFALPVLAWTAWRLSRTRTMAAADWACCAGFLALPLGLYLFLPLRSLRGPVLDWEEPNTWARFWAVVLRRRYGTLQLAQGAQAYSLSGIANALRLFGGLLYDELGPIWLLAAAAGAVAAWKRSRDFGAACLVLAFLSGPFFFILSKMGPGPNARAVMERFLPSFLLVAAVWTGGAVQESPVLGVLLVLAGLAWHPSSAWADSRGAFFSWDHGLAQLRSLPPGSLLFTERADEVEFALAYLRVAQDRRPDVRFVDANAGVTPSIYGEDYYGVWGPPRLRRREAVETTEIARWPGPAFYATVEPEMVSVPRVRDGVLFRAKGEAREAGWPEVLAVRPSFAVRRERELYGAYEQLLTRYWLERGRGDDARREVWKGAAAASDPAQWLQWSAVWAFERGDYALAAQAGRLSSGLRPDPLTLSNLGAAVERLHRPQEAQRAYEQALELDPANLQALYNLGAVCWSRQDAACAASAWERYLSLKPDASEVRAFLARARSVR